MLRLYALSSLALLGCGGREVAPDNAPSCGESVASYCAVVPGGCPAGPSETQMCAWFSARGIPPARAWSGGPIDCEPPKLSGYAVYGTTTRKFFFDEQGQLAVVLDEGHCVAGPRVLRLHSCIDWLVALGCPDDAGAD